MGGLREYYGELLKFPDKSSNFGLLYGRVYGPLSGLKSYYPSVKDECEGIEFVTKVN